MKFDPDWVIAPSETLKDFLGENGMSPNVLAVGFGGRAWRDHALVFIQDVLDRKPLTDEHAHVLAKCTGVSKQLWLNLEHNYRVGLAAGKKDVSDD